MATGRLARAGQQIPVHQDATRPRYELGDESSDELNESEGSQEDNDCTQSDASAEEETVKVDEAVLEDMRQLESSFKGISKRYRLVDRIGEGTFSTVYKAIDLEYGRYQNEWDFEEKENWKWSPSKHRYRRKQSREHVVAIKKIYVTSSPQRIMNELELLHDLRNCKYIAPLITAFRDRDQVIAILPYFRHFDFRAYFRNMGADDLRCYFRSLFTGLSAVHRQEILHRDIKPTNFLYDFERKRGVLVDFGLAEREGTDYQQCLCEVDGEEKDRRISQAYVNTRGNVIGYPKGDSRQPLRANRAGTRGFRAPEVLFKCTAQTTKIDVWSAGIILLTILCKRFPFFNSNDDIEAVIELATIFGLRNIKKCALFHGHTLDTNIPTIGEKGYTFESMILWSVGKPVHTKDGRRTPLNDEEKTMVNFLNGCLNLDSRARMSAEQALNHPFLRQEGEEEESGSEDDMNVLSVAS